MIAVTADLVVPLAEILLVAAEQTALVHDQHAEPVAGVEQFRRGRIMRGANGVAAERLQLGDAERLERVWQGGADARHVLVIAGALQFVVLAIQQKAVRRIEADGADAERGFGLVNGFAIGFDGRDEFVKSGDSGGRPEFGAGTLDSSLMAFIESPLTSFTSLAFATGFPSGEMISKFTVVFGLVGERIQQPHLNVDFRLVRRHVVFEF